jgi:hypothetical protein
MIEFDETDRKLLEMNGVPTSIIDIIEQWISDTWCDGVDYGQSD